MTNYLTDILSTISPEFAHRIGEISILSGRLEHVMLVVLARLRQIPVEAAYAEYAKTTAGIKLNGIRVCDCQKATRGRSVTRPYISSFYGTHPELITIGNKIVRLIEKRNMLVHGLIIEAECADGKERATIIYNNKKYTVHLSDLDEMSINLLDVIGELNGAIPTGLGVEWSSCGSIETWKTNAFTSE